MLINVFTNRPLAHVNLLIGWSFVHTTMSSGIVSVIKFHFFKIQTEGIYENWLPTLKSLYMLLSLNRAEILNTFVLIYYFEWTYQLHTVN